jgi:nickel-dependent lactate racemase
VLVRALLEAGVPASGITVLVATGLHRPNEGEELSELIGDEWVEQTVTCVNHFARNDEDHVHVGTTSRGTVVRLDRRFVDAEVRIATGLVEPHFMAGYSGERSICCSIYFELCGSPAAAPALTGATDSHTRKLSTTTDNFPWFRLHASALTVRYVLCPHVRAGGRKVISPGIAHAETITTFHSARFMEDPKAVEGNLDGYAIIGTAQHTAAV